MKCPSCRTENPSDSKFCKECATPFPSSKDAVVLPTKTFQAPIKELTTGTTFAGRYQVIEELGKGGMGKVYKVIDNKIKEKIALKLIKPEIASEKETIERFGNELKFARKIRHRNVCAMFDLGEAEETHFITMEFVSGEDLKKLVRKVGQMSAAKAIAIARQVCEGLAEAHSLGIVHRDLKPQNIMVDEAGNAKIMDFGIARSFKAKGITDAGAMIGTPEYMSPEQVEGKEIDQRADIYSLGVVLYELLAGKTPFEGESALSIAFKHKTEMPRDPREFNPQIPDDLGRLVLKCLEKDKAARYQSAEAILSELALIETGTTTVSGSRKPKTAIPKGRKIRVPGALAAILIVAVSAAAFILIKSSALNVDPMRIVVAALDNKTGDTSLDSIGGIAADWLSQGIAQTGLVEVVPGMAALESSRLIGSREGGLQSLAQLRSLAKETGAGTVISGAYYLQGGNLQFQTKITDVRHGKLLVALPPMGGKREAPMEAIGELRQLVMGALASLFDSRLKHYPGSKPPVFEAYKEFMTGVGLFGKNYPQAMAHFTRASELDSNYIMPKLWMAIAYGNQGDWQKADGILKSIDQNREQLASFDCHVLDWYKASILGNKEEALKFARLAEKLAPKNYTVNYILGLAELRSNHPKNTLKIYAKLGPWKLAPLYTASASAPWRFYVLAEAHHMLGDFGNERSVLRQGQKIFPESLWLLAYEAGALAAQGKIEAVGKVIEKSLSISSKSGTPGDVMSEAASELRAHGDPDEAKRIADQAVEWYRSRPSEDTASPEYRYELARAFYAAGRWPEAKSLFESLSEEAPDNIDYKGYLGALAARRGDKSEALKISDELGDIDRPYLFGQPAYRRAGIAALLGESQRAVALLNEAFAQGREFGIDVHRNMDLESLRNYKPFQELLRPKD